MLVIEDNVDHAQLLGEAIVSYFPSTKIHTTDSLEEGIQLAGRHRYTAIFIDAFLRNRPVLAHLTSLCQRRRQAPVIVIAGGGDEALAAEVIKHGATEYLVKNRETLERLPKILKKHF